MISIPASENDDFVHVSSGLTKPYLEEILSRSLGKDVGILACASANLCACHYGGVSNSGSTVLRLSLSLSDGQHLDIVAKVLPPCAVNIFKIDRRFDSRLSEIAWAGWWGEQDVAWVPTIYDTRANVQTRDFWIIHEYFPQVGWPGFDATKPKGPGHFSAEMDKLHMLMHHVALLHAYSSLRIEEIRSILPVSDEISANACSPQALALQLKRAADDSSFLSQIGVTEKERASLDVFGDALAHVPQWVEEWDMVCVTADWSPDNFGIRKGHNDELVTFDWGTTRIAPMEEDIEVLFMRMTDLDADQRGDLLAHYLDIYADKTGRRMEPEDFHARIPWARFLVTLRYLLVHIEALRWVPYQTRSKEFIHLFFGLCKKQLEQCRA